ncbi:MAG: ATP synthase F0 subunit B [Cyanobacteria bacterium REEB65]|nr:ATP synthase F0 subunit B [Cyanobacteria bacterium REEB65]
MLSFNLTLLIQMVSFLAFAGLFNLVFFRPIVRHIEARNRYLAEQQAQADSLLKTAQELQEAHQRKIQEAHRAAQAEIDAALRDAQSRRAARLAGVQAEGQNEVGQARERLATERDRLLAELRVEVGDIAGAIAGRILAGSPHGQSRSREGAQA